MRALAPSAARPASPAVATPSARKPSAHAPAPARPVASSSHSAATLRLDDSAFVYPFAGPGDHPAMDQPSMLQQSLDWADWRSIVGGAKRALAGARGRFASSRRDPREPARAPGDEASDVAADEGPDTEFEAGEDLSELDHPPRIPSPGDIYLALAKGRFDDVDVPDEDDGGDEGAGGLRELDEGSDGEGGLLDISGRSTPVPPSPYIDPDDEDAVDPFGRPRSPIDVDLLIGHTLPPHPTFDPSHPSLSPPHTHPLVLTSVLGTGSYAAVYHARSQVDPAHVFAVKAVRARTPAQRAALKVEREAHRRLRGVPGVVGCRRALAGPDAVFLVLEYCPRDLYEEIEAVDAGGDGAGGLGEERTREVVAALADALDAAHRVGVWHRDVKPENVMIGSDGLPRLGDFGLSHLSPDPNPAASDRMSSTLATGSLRYMPPEVLDPRTRAYDCGKADAWSLGVVLLNCLAGRGPWERAEAGDPGWDERLRTRGESLREDFALSDEGLRAVLAALEPDPARRCTVRELGDAVRRAGALLAPPIPAPITRGRSGVAPVRVPTPPVRTWDHWHDLDSSGAAATFRTALASRPRSPCAAPRGTPKSYVTAASWAAAAASGVSWGDLGDEDGEVDYDTVPVFGSDGEDLAGSGWSGGEGPARSGASSGSDTGDGTLRRPGSRRASAAGGHFLFEFDAADRAEFERGRTSNSATPAGGHGAAASQTATPAEPAGALDVDVSQASFFVPLRDAPGVVRRLSERAVPVRSLAPARPDAEDASDAPPPSDAPAPPADAKKRRKKRRPKSKGAAASGAESGAGEGAAKRSGTEGEQAAAAKERKRKSRSRARKEGKDGKEAKESKDGHGHAHHAHHHRVEHATPPAAGPAPMPGGGKTGDRRPRRRSGDAVAAVEGVKVAGRIV